MRNVTCSLHIKITRFLWMLTYTRAFMIAPRDPTIKKSIWVLCPGYVETNLNNHHSTGRAEGGDIGLPRPLAQEKLPKAFGTKESRWPTRLMGQTKIGMLTILIFIRFGISFHFEKEVCLLFQWDGDDTNIDLNYKGTPFKQVLLADDIDQCHFWINIKQRKKL